MGLLLLSRIPLSFWQRGIPTQGLVKVEGQHERRPSQWLRPTALHEAVFLPTVEALAPLE